MARPLTYSPPAPPDTTTQDDLDDLLDALSTSGLLRAAAGTVRSYPHLLGTLLELVDPDTTRHLLDLARSAGRPTPDGLARAAAGVRTVRSCAPHAARHRSTPWALARTLTRRDTRRGVAVVLEVLSVLGRASAQAGRPAPD